MWVERCSQKIWISAIRVKSDKSNVFLVLFVPLLLFFGIFFFFWFEMSQADCIISIIHKNSTTWSQITNPDNQRMNLMLLLSLLSTVLNNDSVDCLFCFFVVVVVVLPNDWLSFQSNCVFAVGLFFFLCEPTKKCQSINLNVYSCWLCTRLTNMKFAVLSVILFVANGRLNCFDWNANSMS